MGIARKINGVYTVFRKEKIVIKVKVGESVLWKPDLSDLLIDFEIPSSIDYVVTILEINLVESMPMAFVCWNDESRSWVRVKDLRQIIS